MTIVIVTHDMSMAGKVGRVVAIRDGMTSSEFIARNPSISALDGTSTGLTGEDHEEYVVLDRAGRLQVPKAYLSALQIDGKATMEFDGEKIMIKAPKDLSANEGIERIESNSQTVGGKSK